MGNHENRARKLRHHVLQPDDRVHVEMVGRFIKYQQLRIARQRARERHALAHAARERTDAGIGGEAQTRQYRFNTMLDTPAIMAFQQLLRHLHLLECARFVQADF